MPSEHFKSPFERAIATTLKIYSGINRNAIFGETPRPFTCNDLIINRGGRKRTK
jgi:hypothetical protein